MKAKIVAVLMALAVCFSAVQFQSAGDSLSAKADAASAISGVEHWVVGSEETVLQDLSYSAEVKGEKQVEISLARNEYESAQVIVTPSRDIGSAVLKAGDLVHSNGTDKIAASDISVAFEKYVQIDTMSSSKAPVQFGKYPDALIPMDAMAAKGLNSIKAGENQGFYVKVFASKDTAAGTYTGSLTLDCDGETCLIPVSVKVWNITLPDETHTQTYFGNFREFMMNGEFDNSEEIVVKYYEFLLDYRMAFETPDFERASDNSTQFFVDWVKKYYDRVSTIKYIGNDFQGAMVALAKACEEDGKNYFDKVFVYGYDEPDHSNQDAVTQAKQGQTDHDAALAAAVAQLEAEGFFDTAKVVTRDDILQVRHLVTTYIDNVSFKPGDIQIYSPLLNEFDTEQKRSYYKQHQAMGEDHEVWWYVCWTPTYPYPNFRVEESRVGPRVMSWMQKEYDIDGFLYWGTAVYSGVTGNDQSDPRNPYEDPYSYKGSISTYDGQLLYPGKMYGVDGPIASLRLESLRDGLEDYEYLYMLEEKINETQDMYGSGLSFDDIMEPLYRSLYTGVVPNYRADSLTSARAEVAEMLELLSSSQALISVGQVDTVDNTVDVKIYVGKDAQVYIDGSETPLSDGVVSVDGMVYTVTKTLSEANNHITIKIVSGGQTYETTKFIGKKPYTISTASSGADGWSTTFKPFGGKTDANYYDSITLSQADVSAVNYVDVEVKNYTTDDLIEMTEYTPHIVLPIAENTFGNVSPENIERLVIPVRHTSGEQITGSDGSVTLPRVKIYLCYGNARKLLGDFGLECAVGTDGAMTEIALEHLNLTDISWLADADSIMIEFRNPSVGVNDVYRIGPCYYTMVE